MKKTFITTMPDEPGAFLKAGLCIAEADANITRVSYNKAVDMHMLFLDVEGTEEQIEKVSSGLKAIGYTSSPYADSNVMLVEVQLKDVPGAVLPILKLIHNFNFNITYISSQETGTPYQYFKMGLLIENAQKVKDFLDQASAICNVRIVEYDRSEKVLDNTVFYLGFVKQTSEKLNLSYENTQDLIVHSNRLMQLLDERSEPPHKTFEYIGKFADILHSHQGESFNPRVSKQVLEDGLSLFSIEPPCGSNTFILENEKGLVFVDSGFACFENEMLKLLRDMFPHFDTVPKFVLVTHPDIDHCGLLHLFDKAYLTKDCLQHFLLELKDEPNFREKNPAHSPYSRISRILSSYTPPDKTLLELFSPDEPEEQIDPIVGIGEIELNGLRFSVYRGNGGHAIGEAVIVNERHKLIFSGDIVINPDGLTPEQSEFNLLAPYLMTSVNMDSEKARLERNCLLEMFSPEKYTYCCGHGAIMEPTV